jgi:hypothetical protein
MPIQRNQNRPFAGSGVKPLGVIKVRQIRMTRPGKPRDYINSRLPARGSVQR